MALARPIEAIDADDETIRDALAVADIPSLLPALAHLTGDLSLLRSELRIDPALMGEDQGGLSEDQQRAARELAFEVLTHFRDAGSVPAGPPSEEQIQRILDFMAG